MPASPALHFPLIPRTVSLAPSPFLAHICTVLALLHFLPPSDAAQMTRLCCAAHTPYGDLPKLVHGLPGHRSRGKFVVLLQNVPFLLTLYTLIDNCRKFQKVLFLLFSSFSVTLNVTTPSSHLVAQG